MANDSTILPSDVLQQLEYWKVDKANELAYQVERRNRENWIIQKIGPVHLAGLSRTLHTDAKVDITYKQERAFDQVALVGLAARHPFLVGSLLLVEYKVNGRQLTTLLSKSQDEALRQEVLTTFTLKDQRPNFSLVK